MNSRDNELHKVTKELKKVQQNYDNVEKELSELQKQLDQIAILEARLTEELLSVEKQLHGDKGKQGTYVQYYY
jgi:uncharacterized protein YoxC